MATVSQPESLFFTDWRTKTSDWVPLATAIFSKKLHVIANRQIYQASILFAGLLLLLTQATIAKDRKLASSLTPGEKISQTSALSIDSLLTQIETIHTTLNRIQYRNQRGFATHNIDENLPELKSNLQTITDNLSLYNSVLDVKNLQMLLILLQDIQSELEDWRTSLSAYNKELVGIHTQLAGLKKGFLLQALPADSSVRVMYVTELKKLQDKWRVTNQDNQVNLTEINQLQASVSNSYFQNIELQNTVKDQLRQFRTKTTGQEHPYLWSIPERSQHDEELSRLAKKSYEGQHKILKSYFKRNWDNSLWIITISILFFWWVYSNFQRLKQANNNELEADTQLKYLKPVPLVSTLVVIFNLAPFFDLHPPSVYVETMQFFLLISLSVFFARNWPKRLFHYWIAICLLYILFAFTNNMLSPAFWPRFWLLILNISSVSFGVLFLIRIRKFVAIPAFVRYVAGIYILLNVAATLLNIVGRLSLAKTCSIAAIFGLTQVIGLSVFIQLIREAVYLQMKTSKITKGIGSKFDSEAIQKGVSRILFIVVIIFWIVIFTTNLNLYGFLYMSVERLLTTPRTLGNTSFTLGNILLFFTIIYLSRLLQKYVGYFFGETDDELIPDKRGSKLVVTRLILLILGFLLAIVASGLPIDKITIVLGALGVGIGLGLQNIVNNLVSGVILIFERPFQIGDSIEVANRKGRVKDIGIRSSRLITAEGSEVIVPNGDLLSGHVVNWTLNGEHVRIELLLKVDTGNSLELVKEYIIDEIINSPNTLQSIPPEILLEGISEKSLELKVMFWINNIRKEQVIKSEILTKVYTRFIEKEIKIG